MSSDIDSASSVHTEDPSGLPFDPPGSVRMTAELHYRHYDDRRPIVNQYLRGHRVGKGQHGEVWVCWDLSDNRRELAIKAVKRNNPRAEKMNMLRRRNIPASSHTPLTEKLGSLEHKIRKEIAIMKKCRHGHVVRLLEVIDDKLNDRIYMVMEYLSGGEIKWRNEQSEPVLQVDQCRRICRDVILGLEYLHYQGIIHRDIKPANLLWTADRQMVKISDFGVSHFSYAQRLAAAGRGKVALDDANDPILLDDSDLSKRAGTPPFLAPEVIAEYNSTDPSPSISASATLLSLRSATHIGSSSTVRPTTSQRLQITKAIDVWALGVTLYCLLFGKIPFRAEDSSEYVLYNIICKHDWEPEDTMGCDRISTGGRKPKDKKSEGFVVMNLLDKLLEKDPNKRMTLDQAKRYVWFLRDIPHHQEWLRQTSPSRIDMVHVTESDTRTAMTTVRFSWGWPKRLTRRISSLFKGVRSSRAASSRDDEDDFGVCSSPAIAYVERHKSASGRLSNSEIDENGKRRGVARSDIVRNDSTPNMGRRQESIERWARNASKGREHDSNVSGSRSRWRESNTLLPLDQNQPCSLHSHGRPTSCGRENNNTPLPDDAMFLGAGGVCNDPSSLVSSNLPLGLNQSTSYSPIALRHPQPERLYVAPPASAIPDPPSHDPGHNRQPTIRSATQSPSPLQQVAYGSEPSASDDDYDDVDYDDVASDSSFFRDTHRDRQAESEAFQANTSLVYEEADEDESDEEMVPIEVKRRRPSVSVTAASPVPFSDSSDDARSR